MTANLSPVFTLTPNIGNVSFNTANTNRDGTGTIAILLTAGANGTMIERVTIHGIATTTAGMIRLFVFNGTNMFLYEEIPVTAITPSGTVPAFSALSVNITPATPLVLPSGYSLRVSTNNLELFHAVAEGGDF